MACQAESCQERVNLD